MLRSLRVGLLLLLGWLAAGCGAQPAGAPATPVVQSNASASPLAISASPSPSSPIQFVQVQVTPTDAVIWLQNTAGPNQATSVDVGGWALEVGSTRVVLPANTSVAPGQTLLVHAGPAPGSAPSPLPVPSASAGALPAASPAAAPSPAVGGTPQPTPTNAVEIFLGPSGEPLRQALQPGAQVSLVNGENVLQSQYVIPR